MSPSAEPIDSEFGSTNLYFGYGSNLWLEQMAERCPDSKFAGIGRLRNYRWIINERGSANPLPLQPHPDLEDESTHVWGMVYTLSKSDEAILDRKEGVPEKHTKEVHNIEFWPTDSEKRKIDINASPQRTPVLLYIDRKRVKEDKPREEYIYRMNMGVVDALKMGIPSSYVGKVIRQYIPDIDGCFDKDVLELTCGKELYTALDTTHPSGVDKFEALIRQVTPTTQQGSLTHTATLTTAQSSPGTSTGTQGTVTTHGMIVTSPPLPVPTVGQTSPYTSFKTIDMPAFLELCVITGKHEVKLGDIDIKNIKNDGELFKKIWQEYRRLRGTMGALFVEPRNVHFVKFEVLKQNMDGYHLAGIQKAPKEIPPELEEQHRRYHYHECPLPYDSPMPCNLFLHYLDHARRFHVPDGKALAHHRDTFLDRLPKKLQESIFAAQIDTALGWGVQIIEGLSLSALSAAFALAVVVTFLVSVVFTVVAKSQEQGFSIGQWLMAVLASGMTAWYYREAERNSIVEI